jgi:hypothetical protein
MKASTAVATTSVTAPLHYGHFLLGGGREHDVLGVHLLGRLRNVEGVVGDTLEIAEGVQIFGHVVALLVGELLAGYLHQIGAQLVLVAVHGVLRVLYLTEAVVGISGEKIDGSE